MGNACVSSNSTTIATQTGSTGKNQRRNVNPQIEIDGKPVQLKTWDDVFDHVSRVDLWEGTPRADRPEWKPILTKIEEISNLDRQQDAQDTKVKEFLQGRQQDLADRNNTVLLYVCSTGTDTEAERTVLMKDVYPFISNVCRKLSLEFEVVDLRWGEQGNGNDPGKIQTYMLELKRCMESNGAAAFLCFLSEEYGTRILPREIEEETLDTITAYLINNQLDTGLVKQFYILDKNSIRRKYILKQTPGDTKYQKKASADTEKLLNLMKEVVPQCFPCGSDMISKYFASLYEYEIRATLDSSGQKIFVKKVVGNRPQCESLAVSNDYDKEQLDRINKEISKTLDGTKDTVFSLTYDDMNEMASGENMVQLSNCVCEKLLQHVVRYYKTSEPFIRDLLLQEILIHNRHLMEISREFYGREADLEKVRKYVQDDNIRVPLVVHGGQSVGKSAFMATAARTTRLPHYVMVTRQIGITTGSTFVKDLIASICSQLIRAYDRPIWNISASYRDLSKCFRDCLSFATKDEPIVMFLSSIDKLSDEFFEYNVRWLQFDRELPEHVKIVLSTTSGRSLEAMRHGLSASQFLEIVPVEEFEVPGILQKKLSGMGQQITYDQTQKLLELYQSSPSSLLLGVGAKLASTWRSYDPPEAHSHVTNVTELIHEYMVNIEDRYDQVLVHHALAYITASKSGLSQGEIEDILSCDDEVLEAVFRTCSPPIRRIPPSSWLRIKHDLKPLLTERIHRGMRIFTWYHHQIAELARERYLLKPFGADKEPFEKKARSAISNYFDNIWYKGKLYSNLGKETLREKFATLENRYVLNQPIVAPGESKSRGHLNTRKLSELPYQLTMLKNWTHFVNCMSLGFIQAKYEDGLGFECFRDVSIAAKMSDNTVLKQLARLVASHMTVLWKEPSAIYQIASQSPNTGPIFKMLKTSDARDIPTRFIRNISVLKEENTCEMTLQGHSAGVRYCDVSPSGDMIVSTADDGSLNIWYIMTGMELAAMTSLPLPMDSDQIEAIASNPCCFSPTGDRIALGTEDGSVKMLDDTGTMVNQENTDNERITCIKFSRDGKTLVTSFRKGHLYFWDVDTLEHQSTIQLEETITGLDISPDGQLLAVACARGLVLVDMATRVILSSGVDTMTLAPNDQETSDCFALCCAFHPSGNEVLVGSTDNSISQWSVGDGRISHKAVGHYGWVTSIKLNTSGDTMFTASADRTIKVWTFQTKWRCTSTLIGHSDIVTMVTLEPVKESYLVSTSLDGTIKVWNIKSLKTQEEVGEKDDGFEEGSDVTDQDNNDDVSEHVPFNTLSISPSSGIIVSSKGSERYCTIRRPGCPTVNTAKLPSPVKQAIFTADGSKIVILNKDLNKGQKKHQTIKTSVFIIDTDTGSTDHVIDPLEFGDDEIPTSICCGAWFIAIGTNKGDVHIYDDKALENLQRITWHDEITEMATCTVKNYVIAVSFKQAIILKVGLDRYETVTYLPETEFDYSRCVFSPVGNCLVTGLENGEIIVWKMSDTDITLSASRTDHTSKVKDIAFSRSGDVMVTCADRSMRVWDLSDGVSLQCTYYDTIERVVCVEEDVALAGDVLGKLNTLTW